MMPSERKITRENALDIIKKFAKEYRKELGKTNGEIIIVGGGSIMLNYRFRDSTQDFDVILRTVSGITDVITKFADENHLPRGWMNSDFMKTSSYSDKLAEVSKHFCTLNNGTLEIRTITGEYLIAMKLRAHRDYRNDFSDVIGILIEENDLGRPISLNCILSAYHKLYNENLNDMDLRILEEITSLPISDLKEKYADIHNKENEMEYKIMKYIDNGANIHAKNVDEVIAAIKRKMDT